MSLVACFSILPCRESNVFLLLFVSVACISLTTVQYITLIQFKPKLDPIQENTRNYTLPTEWGSLIPLDSQSPILDLGRRWQEFLLRMCTTAAFQHWEFSGCTLVWGGRTLNLHCTVLLFILFWPAVNIIRLKWAKGSPIQGKFSKKPQILRLETIHCCDFFKEESNQIKFMTQ